MWLKTNQQTASWRSVQVRLFFICWLIYLLHWSPFVVRELYLTINLAEKASVRVDEYVDQMCVVGMVCSCPLRW